MNAILHDTGYSLRVTDFEKRGVQLVYCGTSTSPKDKILIIARDADELLNSGFLQTVSPDLTEQVRREHDSTTKEAQSILHKSEIEIEVYFLPKIAARINNFLRPDSVLQKCSNFLKTDKKTKHVFLVLNFQDPEIQTFSRGIIYALYKSVPLFSLKKQTESCSEILVTLYDSNLKDYVPNIDSHDAYLGQTIRRIQCMVDMPPNILNVEEFVDVCTEVKNSHPAVELEVLRGPKLTEGNFFGTLAVGRAAVQKPAVCILKFSSGREGKRLCLVGKGIVYDSGGLSLKTAGGMRMMKVDMGGAAAVLGAFDAIVNRLESMTTSYFSDVCCVCLLAENAIDKESYRVDDIIQLKSGKTVEITNTDAEGRLLLADGLSYASTEYDATHIIDMATLTGAQVVATGDRIAAVISNSEELESRLRKAGKQVGELLQPLPYIPEFFAQKFESEVADLRNTHKDAVAPGTSTAAQFLAEHLNPNSSAVWAHLDIAGPVTLNGDRASGFGVACVTQFACEYSD